MKNIIKWCIWEMKNDFVASGYFAVMLLMYCIIELVFGINDVDILIIFEMFVVNYVLTILHRLFLDDEKDYTSGSFLIRASVLSVISLAAVIAVSRLGGWFDKMPFWAEITIYIVLISSYLTVWFLVKFRKKYDTQKLNEQLDNYKKLSNLSNE